MVDGRTKDRGQKCLAEVPSGQEKGHGTGREIGTTQQRDDNMRALRFKMQGRNREPSWIYEREEADPSGKGWHLSLLCAQLTGSREELGTDSKAVRSCPAQRGHPCPWSMPSEQLR